MSLIPQFTIQISCINCSLAAKSLYESFVQCAAFAASSTSDDDINAVFYTLDLHLARK